MTAHAQSRGTVEAVMEQFREPGSSRLSTDSFMHIVGVNKETLARLAGVDRTTLFRNPRSEKIQHRLREAAQVIAMAADAAEGDLSRAVFWFTNVPLVELGGKTALQLVAEGKSEGLRRYVLNLSAGATG